MKRILIPLLLIAITSVACVISTPAAPGKPVLKTPVSETAPAEAAPTATPTPASSATPLPTSTPAPTATITASPTPQEDLLWNWAGDPQTGGLLAINQHGEQRLIGTLTVQELETSTFKAIDRERAFLFLGTDKLLRVFLLSPETMQPLSLPGAPLAFDPDYSAGYITLAGVYGSTAAFTYPVETSWSGTNVSPNTGPLYWVDLHTLRVEQIETNANFNYGDPRKWFPASPDGRSLRYRAGAQPTNSIRELDMQTGAARTIFTTTGSAFNLVSSEHGDLWKSYRDKALLDLDGQTLPYDDALLVPRPIASGMILLHPWNCAGDCPLQIARPFGEDPGLAYTLPWPLEEGILSMSMTRLLPDHTLLLAGAASYQFAQSYPAVAAHPELLEMDNPLFRLAPGGESRLLGSYDSNDLGGQLPFSRDGRYLLLKKTDQSAYFIYDAFEDRELAAFPLAAGVEWPLASFKFQESGIQVKITFSYAKGGGDWEYETFLHSYTHLTGAVRSGQIKQPDLLNCPYFLAGGSLQCWAYTPGPGLYSLVNIDPASGEILPLVENVIPLTTWEE